MGEYALACALSGLPIVEERAALLPLARIPGGWVPFTLPGWAFINSYGTVCDRPRRQEELLPWQVLSMALPDEEDPFEWFREATLFQKTCKLGSVELSLGFVHELMFKNVIERARPRAPASSQALFELALPLPLSKRLYVPKSKSDELLFCAGIHILKLSPDPFRRSPTIGHKEEVAEAFRNAVPLLGAHRASLFEVAEQAVRWDVHDEDLGLSRFSDEFERGEEAESDGDDGSEYEPALDALSARRDVTGRYTITIPVSDCEALARTLATGSSEAGSVHFRLEGDLPTAVRVTDRGAVTVELAPLAMEQLRSALLGHESLTFEEDRVEILVVSADP